MCEHISLSTENCNQYFNAVAKKEQLMQLIQSLPLTQLISYSNHWMHSAQNKIHVFEILIKI